MPRLQSPSSGLNILLTGGLGYIGSHTAVMLQQTGHGVVLLDNLSNSRLYVCSADPTKAPPGAGWRATRTLHDMCASAWVFAAQAMQTAQATTGQQTRKVAPVFRRCGDRVRASARHHRFPAD
ncbi:NAD-dependent epimerase/dehydratase family protein [Sulfuricystis thermophila]|uniref:NAD-dependent epimerase/dehydratase family protein n=1 Tax=Sulfuricystis thermophila TaxID=2496847 RepID=UPI003D674B4A